MSGDAGIALEPVFRETFLADFREPAHVEILRLAGDLLHTLAVETFYWLGEEDLGLCGLRRDLTAAAADLDHLVSYLQAIAWTPAGGLHDPPGPSEEVTLRRAAEAWAERVGRVVGEMREAVGQSQGGSAG